MKAPELPIHWRLRRAIDGATERLALRAVLAATRLLGVAAGTHLRQSRGAHDPLAVLQARLEEAELRARLAMEVVDIVGARFERVPDRRRPYYSPAQRFRILEIKRLLAWNAHQVAQTFLVCPNTVYNWERATDHGTRTIGSTVKPTPPIRRAADVVQSVSQHMVRLGFGGQDLIARVLARAGWKISARSVARYAKAHPVLTPPPFPSKNGRRHRPVIARFVHHTWMMDVSEVKQFLGPTLYIAAAFDAFSRVPIALQVFDQKPTAPNMRTLFTRAAKAFTRPRYLITDLGGEFIGGTFKEAVTRLGTCQRFASRENLYATARLERFWRTLKDSAGLHRLGLPMTREDLERRLELALTHYVAFRPHEGLRGATPLEAFLGGAPAHLRAVEPPRGLSGKQAGQPPPFAFDFLGGDQRFPILTKAA